ncbi:prohead protease/major capsid protein fusion protein [Mameliella sp.]|uniref:prohead protease/major capsid protein fusion protein n=1 Tax=Mameliella sp. TaxID=1924940 RepID=UPI003BAC4C5B
MTQSQTEVRRPDLMTQAAPLGTVDEEARTVEVVFSTAALVNHWVMHRGEVRRMPTRVVIEDDAVDLEFLRASGPVLDSHFAFGTDGVIGVVEDAWIDAGVCKAKLRFAQTEDVEPIWSKIAQGVLRNISVGFTVLAQEVRIETGEDGAETEVMYFTRWRPDEVSVCAVPADMGSRIQSKGSLPLARQHSGDLAGERPGEANAAPPVEAASGAAQDEAAAAVDTQEEADMAEQTQSAAGEAQTQTVDRDAILRQERERIAGIEDVAAKLGVDAETVKQAREGDVTVDDFRAQAIDAYATKAQSKTQGLGGPTASVTADERDRFRQGAALGLMARAGLEGGERNEFTGFTLAELARQSLQISGARASGSRLDMVGQAFVQSGAGAHSTSDFANILANIAQKAALMGWEEAEETYQIWTRAGTLTDFRPAKRVGLGLIDSLPEKPEGGEYKYGTVGDRGEPITLATYGKILKITREAIINDDLSLFSSLPRASGRAARRTIGNLCYAVLTGNPNMSDGTALFHADHNNLAGSGGAPSVTTLGAARAAMRKQKEKAGGPSLNIRPAYFLVPAALETSAQQLMTSIVDPTAQKGHANNPVAGMAEVVTDARMDDASATAWYMAANPSMHDTVEVAYLDGVQEPFIEEKTAWSTDGVELKVRIDAGVAPLDWRTFYKNPG